MSPMLGPLGALCIAIILLVLVFLEGSEEDVPTDKKEKES